MRKTVTVETITNSLEEMSDATKKFVSNIDSMSSEDLKKHSEHISLKMDEYLDDTKSYTEVTRETKSPTPPSTLQNIDDSVNLLPILLDDLRKISATYDTIYKKGIVWKGTREVYSDILSVLLNHLDEIRTSME